MTQCPCGSGDKLDACCGPVIIGRSATSAEGLLRSRYTAFALGDVAYLADTLTPDMRVDFDEIEAESTAKDAQWQGLEIRNITGGGEGDETGTIEFVARFKLRDQQRLHHELASFRREDGRWLCAGAEINPKGPPRQVNKVGRNDPCPCGSGRKYKKCCGG